MSVSTPLVLVAAAPTLQRQGLLATLQEQRPDLFLRATANASTLPERLRREAPALLILDVSLPGPPLISLLNRVRQVRPRQRLLVLGGRRLPLALQRHLVDMGAGALLARQVTPADVLAAVGRLLGRDAPIPLKPAAKPITAEPATGPSARELEVLHWVSQDYSTTEIAAQLCISARTVDAHRRALLQKTNTRSTVGLVLHAVRQGWIELG